MSWITLADWIRRSRGSCSPTPEISGPVNLTTPHPVTNAEFTVGPGRGACTGPGCCSCPVPALKLALGGVSSDLLSSARVMPRRLEAAGYRFRFPDLPRRWRPSWPAQPVPS